MISQKVSGLSGSIVRNLVHFECTGICKKKWNNDTIYGHTFYNFEDIQDKYYCNPRKTCLPLNRPSAAGLTWVWKETTIKKSSKYHEQYNTENWANKVCRQKRKHEKEGLPNQKTRSHQLMRHWPSSCTFPKYCHLSFHFKSEINADSTTITTTTTATTTIIFWIRTCPRSPPKRWIFSWTHSRATAWSLNPWEWFSFSNAPIEAHSLKLMLISSQNLISGNVVCVQRKETKQIKP